MNEFWLIRVLNIHLLSFSCLASLFYTVSFRGGCWKSQIFTWRQLWTAPKIKKLDCGETWFRFDMKKIVSSVLGVTSGGLFLIQCFRSWQSISNGMIRSKIGLMVKMLLKFDILLMFRVRGELLMGPLESKYW